MKQIYPLLLALCILCCGHVNGQTQSNTSEIVTLTDPYFMESQDTVSTHGPHSITRNLLQDKKGNIWLATWQGIINYNGKVFTNFTLKENLIHFHVFYVFEDKAGNLWFATVRGGIYRYNPLAKAGEKPFTLFTTRDGLANNTVSCMLEDKAGNLWFGTPGGVSRYNPLAAADKAFTTFTMADGLNLTNVNCMAQDKTGNVWLAGGGVSCYNGKTFTVFNGKDGLPFKNATSLHTDKSGNMWIGTMEGLFRYAPNAGNTSVTDFLPASSVSYIYEDKAGNLLLSTMDPHAQLSHAGVLYRYNGKTFDKIIEKTEPGDTQIFGAIEDAAGYVWFGTMKGVCRFDVSHAQDPCVKKTCKHDLPLRQAIAQHNEALAKAFTYFNN